MLAGLAMIGFPAAGSRAAARDGDSMTRIALLGDSIFDNAAYVPAGDDVITHLNRQLRGKGEAVLLAQDGAVITDVLEQMSGLSPKTTHLAISVGGNDALRRIDVLARPTRSVAEALAAVAEVREAFVERYGAMLDAVLKAGIPTMICTICDVQLPDAAQRRAGNLALTALNDAILREATARRLPVVDLRVIFDEPGDYANAIEPSGRGAAKIAEVITWISASHDFEGPASLYRLG